VLETGALDDEAVVGKALEKAFSEAMATANMV